MWGEWDGGHRQGAEGVVAYSRTDDGLEHVGLLGQKLGVHAEVKLG